MIKISSMIMAIELFIAKYFMVSFNFNYCLDLFESSIMLAKNSI